MTPTDGSQWAPSAALELPPHEMRCVDRFTKFEKPAAMQGQAAQALERYRDAKTVKCLIDGFSKVKVYSTPSASPQRDIAKALRTITGQKFEYDVKAWKAWQKAAMNSPESTVAALLHQDANVRTLAAQRLSEAKPKDRAAAVAALGTALGAEKKTAVRIAMVQALAKLRPATLANVIVPLLTTNDIAEVEAVAGALDNVETVEARFD